MNETAATPRSGTDDGPPARLGGRRRVIIESVTPQVDAGRFPVKRAAGETMTVEMDAFTDGHDRLACFLHHRRAGEEAWQEVAMRPLVNDRWRASFRVDSVGRYEYTVSAFVDRFASWRHDLARREDEADIAVHLREGAALAEAAAARASGDDRARLTAHAEALLDRGESVMARREAALSSGFAELMARHADRSLAVRFPRVLSVSVDDERARFSTWYEVFPRSCAPEPGRHGTFRDVEARLPHIAGMGFDVLYFPPIHPIGRVNRKGPNNTLVAGPHDPGVPWAIGSEEGGHTAVHPDLGTLEDFRRLVAAARGHGLEIALDIAFQCAPDHPWVKQHPQWFRWRPDGTVQFAENPPKKYQDIYPFDFETEDWRALWAELKSVFSFWIEQGVRIFRVDNPHTKPFDMWEWIIGEVKLEKPDAIFLAEAFTRPKVMHRLAKLGFSQSYTYFTWRNGKQELADYLTELTTRPGVEYFRPNFWPNTPDILHETLQHGGRPAFLLRLVLAANMTANYGIYGPAFELCENAPREPGSEEYLDSEKYQLRHRDRDAPHSLAEFIGLVNRIRRDNPALQQNEDTTLHEIGSDQLLAWSKRSRDGENVVLTVVNLDPNHAHAGWTNLDLGALGVPWDEPFEVHDLLTGEHYTWQGAHNYVGLDPQFGPAHVFLVQRRHSERDFETFYG